jgi:two-component system sensor histidine kinase RpfC
VRQSATALLTVINDILDFSKVEAGKLELERVQFDLREVVDATCDILAEQARAKGLALDAFIERRVPEMIWGDPGRLQQVITNIIANAVKFTERGGVTVHVSTQGETETGVRVKFSIRDTGIGIAPEAQARIFESFTQADQSTTRRFGGTGLGTTIAKQLVVLMKGRIGLESAVGLGSTFWVEVDLEKQPERAGAGRGELADARVLLVGFPSVQRESIEQTLAGWGAVPIAVSSVDDGVARLVAEISLAKPYHSALIYGTADYLKLAQRFRRLAPDPSPPTVLAVMRDAEVQRFEALSAGYAAVLELPFDKRLLFNVLHSVSAGDEVREGVVRLQDYARRGATARRLRLLVADDNPTNREVIGKILERGGNTVTMVDDGDRALDLLETEQFDGVILDRNMPGLGGIEALKALRLMKQGCERVPVIILSADVTTEVKREALEAGADAFLGKPIEALRLLEEVQVLCAERAEAMGRAEPAARAEPATGRSGRPAEAPVVNTETLGHLEELGSSAAFVENLIGVFVADSAALLERIDRALAGRNYGEFRALLHAMKGSSASMGAERLTRICGSLDKLSDSEIRLQSPGLLRAIGDELDAARTELERHARSRRQSAS